MARSRNVPAPHVSLTASPADPEQLTIEILELDRQGKRDAARNVAEIGQRLLVLREQLAFGNWLAWLSERLPYSPRSAQRYITVARWAKANPDDFEFFAPFGLGKLQLLMSLPPVQRARFRRRRRFLIPATGRRKSLAIMTVPEFEGVLGGRRALTATPPALPPATMLRRFSHRVAGLDAMADELRSRSDQLDADDVRDVIEDLRSVADELDAAFG